MFCPECGKALSQPSEGSAPRAVAEESEPTVAEIVADKESEPITQPAPVAAGNEEPAESTSPQPINAAEESKPKSYSLPASRMGKYEKVRESLHHASTATRDALADNVKRVERIRQVSSTMIEEATYDPSLRFVLVALAIFVVFVILLVLSKVMG